RDRVEAVAELPRDLLDRIRGVGLLGVEDPPVVQRAQRSFVRRTSLTQGAGPAEERPVLGPDLARRPAGRERGEVRLPAVLARPGRARPLGSAAVVAELEAPGRAGRA